MQTRKIFYEGRVQGVGFRASVLGLARGYDITGGVKNLPDGRVEVVARGDEAELDDFLTAIRESHLAAHITLEQDSILNPEPMPRARGFTIFKD